LGFELSETELIKAFQFKDLADKKKEISDWEAIKKHESQSSPEIFLLELVRFLWRSKASHRNR